MVYVGVPAPVSTGGIVGIFNNGSHNTHDHCRGCSVAVFEIHTRERMGRSVTGVDSWIDSVFPGTGVVQSNIRRVVQCGIG